MGKLLSPLKISGSVDGLTFRNTEHDGIVVQTKSSLSKEQVKRWESFDRTRRNAAEFGNAIKASKLVRRSLSWLSSTISSTRLSSHMNKIMHQVVMTDPINGLGERHFDAGDYQLLQDFDLSFEQKLEHALPLNLKHQLDITTGKVHLEIPAAIVRRKKTFPKQATHFKIVSGACMADFKNYKYNDSIAETELLPLSKRMPAMQLESAYPVKEGQILMHIVGIVFYTMEKGREKLIKKGAALKIVNLARKEAVAIEAPVAQEVPALIAESAETTPVMSCDQVPVVTALTRSTYTHKPTQVAMLPIMSLMPARAVGRRTDEQPATEEKATVPVMEPVQGDKQQEVRAIEENAVVIEAETVEEEAILHEEGTIIGMQDATGQPLAGKGTDLRPSSKTPPHKNKNKRMRKKTREEQVISRNVESACEENATKNRPHEEPGLVARG